MSQTLKPPLKFQQFCAIKMEHKCENEVWVEPFFFITLNAFIFRKKKHFLYNWIYICFKGSLKSKHWCISRGILHSILYKKIPSIVFNKIEFLSNCTHVHKEFIEGIETLLTYSAVSEEEKHTTFPFMGNMVAIE